MPLRSSCFFIVFAGYVSLAAMISNSKILVEYFKELEEESIRDNFVIIYELLDEIMDYGLVQTTESKILQE